MEGQKEKNERWKLMMLTNSVKNLGRKYEVKSKDGFEQ